MNIVESLFNKFGIVSRRTKNITKHVVISFLYKGGSILTSFLLVPLTINLLDIDNYGIWITLSSFISWFSFFDIGLGNGLRNKFSEAKASGNIPLAKAYVSTAYYTIGCVCLLMIMIFFGVNFFIDWTHIFNTNSIKQKELGILMSVVFSFFCFQLVVKLITTIYTADQHHSMQGKVNFFSSFLSLISIWLIPRFVKGSLLIFGSIFSILPVVLLFGLNIFAFSTKYKDFQPRFQLCKKKYLKDIFGLGITFFILQVAGIILYSTDNFIISSIFKPKDVVPYNIAFKYFSISSMILGLIASPFWSSFTYAYSNRDFLWIEKSMKSLIRLTYVIMLTNVVLLFFSSQAYFYWTNDKVKVSHSLSILMCLFCQLSLFVTPFTIFLNGIGKIKLQALQSLVVALINIPFSFLLAKTSLGVNGVILSTIICFIPSVILAPLQYYKLIKNHANGIWNE